MKKTFWVPITLASLAYLVLPLPGLSAPLSQRIDSKRARARARRRRARACSPPRSRATRTGSRGCKGEITATQTRLGRVQTEPRPAEERAARGPQPARVRARPAREAAHRAGHGAAGARRPAGGDLQGRLARRAHGDPRGRRLRRPARAGRVPRPHLRTRTARSPTRCAGCGTRRRARPASWRASSSASSSPRSASSTSATRSPRCRTSCLSSRNQLASARADRRGALAQVRSSRDQLEGDLASLEAEQARVASALSGAPGPIKPGSGQLIWPVNGPVVSPFGMRWGRLHAGSTSRCPPARRSAPPTRAPSS